MESDEYFYQEKESGIKSLYMKAISVFAKKGMKRTGADAVLLLQLLQVFMCVCVGICIDGRCALRD